MSRTQVLKLQQRVLRLEMQQPGYAADATPAYPQVTMAFKRGVLAMLLEMGAFAGATPTSRFWPIAGALKRLGATEVDLRPRHAASHATYISHDRETEEGTSDEQASWRR